jgi:hypothetical protein
MKASETTPNPNLSELRRLAWVASIELCRETKGKLKPKDTWKSVLGFLCSARGAGT